MPVVALFMTSDILITGSNGFVGSALVSALPEHAVRRALRRSVAFLRPNDYIVGDIGPSTDWHLALAGVDCVVHLAARTHVKKDTMDALYRTVNVEATRNLAQQAAVAGVRRFVFLSSIKVNGEVTVARPFTADNPPHPEDIYGITKREAEDALRDISANTGMEIVILRPPLVYGPGVKGNFLSLMHCIARGVPLPLGSIINRRTLIYVGNLVDAIIAATDSPVPAGKTYLVGDSEDVSTPGLIRSIAIAMHVHPCLLPFPPALLRASANAVGKREEMRRLTGSLQVDSSKIRNELNWNPRFDLAQGLARTAQWYYSQFPVKSNT
jgi:nucleoside-diphosphate-sugar epimerase